MTTQYQKINFIFCRDLNGGIGSSKNKKLEWLIKEDLDFFKEMTRGNVIIMGRKTYECVGILNDRVNVVLTKSEIKPEQNLIIKKNIEELLEFLKNVGGKKIFICGGSEIYSQFWHQPNEIYTKYNVKISNVYETVIYSKYDECDIKFLPEYSGFNLIKKQKYKLFDQKNKKEVEVEFNHYSSTKKLEKIKNNEEQKYLDLLSNLLLNFEKRMTRNGEVYSSFAHHLTFDLSLNFPLLTTKKMFFRGIFEELMFFLRGETNTNKLSEKGVKIWEKNTSTEFLKNQNLKYESGDMGPMYGFQLNYYNAEYKGMEYNYSGFNQIDECIKLLKTDPFSRRIIMTTYNPLQAKEGVLFPCHGLLIQFYVEKKEEKYYLSCMMTQRSADVFLGLPFNIASYSLFVYLLSKTLNFIPGKLTISLGDTHLYAAHYSQSIRQLLRKPRLFPQLKIKNKRENIRDYLFDDFEIINYNSYSGILAEMIA